MKIQHEYLTTSLEKFNDEDLQRVTECRQAMRYRHDPDWVCLYHTITEEDRPALRGQFRPQQIGGDICHCCFVKEAADWKERGWDIPADPANDFFLRMPEDVDYWLTIHTRLKSVENKYYMIYKSTNGNHKLLETTNLSERVIINHYYENRIIAEGTKDFVIAAHVTKTGEEPFVRDEPEHRTLWDCFLM